jgi:flagellar hook assembly protein FlgD
LPNPFNPATRIRFSITRPGPARLDIYDVRGRYIATLLNEPVPPGAHEVQWNGRRADGAVASTGVYCVRLVANGGTDTCKMLLLK